MSETGTPEFDSIPIANTTADAPPRRESISTMPASPPLDPPALSAPSPRPTIPIPVPKAANPKPVNPNPEITATTAKDPVVNKFVNVNAEPTTNRSIPPAPIVEKPPVQSQSSMALEIAMAAVRPTRAKLIFATGLASLLAGAGFVKLLWPLPRVAVQSELAGGKKPDEARSPLSPVPGEMNGGKKGEISESLPKPGVETVAAPSVKLDFPAVSPKVETGSPGGTVEPALTRPVEMVPKIELPGLPTEAGSRNDAASLIPRPVVLDTPPAVSPVPPPKVHLAAGAEPVGMPAPTANSPASAPSGIALPSLPGMSTGSGPATPPVVTPQPEVKSDLPKLDLPKLDVSSSPPAPAISLPSPKGVELPVATPPAPSITTTPPAVVPAPSLSTSTDKTIDLGSLPRPAGNSEPPLPKLDLPVIESTKSEVPKIEASKPVPSRDPGSVPLPELSPLPEVAAATPPAARPAPSTESPKPLEPALPRIDLTPSKTPPPAVLPPIKDTELPPSVRITAPAEPSKIQPAQASMVDSPVKSSTGEPRRSTTIQTDYDEDLHYPQAGDTFTSVSKKYYGDERYASAIQAHNDGRSISELRSVRIPPIHVLRKRFPSYIGRPTADGVSATRENIPGGLKTFIVPAGGRTIKQVSEAAFGDENLWGRVFDLNRGLYPDRVIPEGTRLSLPADSRIGN